MKLHHSILTMVMLAAMPSVHASELLSDNALNQITAGTASAVYNNGQLSFDLSKTTSRGTSIGAQGDLNFNPGTANVNTNVLKLQDNAQGNLRALVNTNAVNSAVQVLINLNVSINSRIDVLNQINNGLQQK